MAVYVVPTLQLPSDLTYLPVARAFVDALCRAANVEQRALDAIVLATNEAVSNVIRHAHQGKSETDLRLECIISQGMVEVRVHDRGAPFQLSDVPAMSPCEMRVGGRGVFLMRAMLDELECLPLEEGGNVLRMVKRFAAQC